VCAPRADTSVPTQSIATSPVLTQMLRSAPGVASPPAEHTRRIRERSSAQGAHAPFAASSAARLTRRMLRSWPLLATLALGASLALAAQRAPRTKPEPQAARAPHPAPEPPPAQTAAPTTRRAQPEPVADHDAVAPGHDTQPQAAASQTAKTQPPDAARAHGSSQQETAPDPATRATLSINALPWGEVSIDGRAQGNTPLRGLKLKPGTHRLSVRCPPLDRTAELTVELAPKADARLVVDLQRAPVRTFLDGAKEVR
jgi:hypothetical protein